MPSAAAVIGTYMLKYYMYFFWMLDNFACFLSSADLFFSKINIFFKIFFRNAIGVSNSLDSDQARRSVMADLGPNCLQRLSADETCR